MPSIHLDPITCCRATIKACIFPPNKMPANIEQKSSVKLENEFNFLVDTGATTSCITRCVAEKCGLEYAGSQFLRNVEKRVPTSTYFADIMLMGVGLKIHRFLLYTTNLPPDHAFQGMMGMDILRKGSLYFGKKENGEYEIRTFSI